LAPFTEQLFFPIYSVLSFCSIFFVPFILSFSIYFCFFGFRRWNISGALAPTESSSTKETIGKQVHQSGYAIMQKLHDFKITNVCYQLYRTA
jgi:hypothetical protein